MKKENNDSRLIPILREGIAIIQMIFFKSLKPVIARKTLAHKLARACYYIMRDQIPFDEELLFG